MHHSPPATHTGVELATTMMMTEQATNDAIDGKEEKYAAYMKRIIELRQEFSKWKQIYEVC